MGCWNNTCNITNLPILYGDNVALIFLVEATNNNLGFTYNPDDKFLMFGFPIFGEYNDYGSIENIQHNTNMLEFILNQNLYLYELNNKTKFKPSSIQEFVNNVCNKTILIEFEDEIFIENEFKQEIVYKQIIPFMVHKDVYNIIIENEGNRIIDKKTYFNFFTNFVKEQELECRDAYLQQKELQKKDGKPHKSFNSLWDLENSIGISENTRHRKVPSIINSLFIKNEKLSNEDILQIVHYKLFINGLKSLRKGFFVSSGLGSQRKDFELHKLIAEWILNKIQTIEN